MPADFTTAKILLAFLVPACIVALATLFGGKQWFRHRYRQGVPIRRAFEKYLAGGPLPAPPERAFDQYLDIYSRLRDEVVIPEELQVYIAERIRERKLDRQWEAQLAKGNRSKRMMAVTKLCLIGGSELTAPLIARLKEERSPLVKMRIAHELARANVTEAIPAIVDTIRTSEDWYRFRIVEILFTFGVALREYAIQLLDAGDEIALPIAFAFGRRFLNPTILKYIMAAASGDGPYVLEAVAVLAARYPDRLEAQEFLAHPDPVVRGQAWAAVGRRADKQTLLRLVEVAADKDMAASIGQDIADMVQRAPTLLPTLMKAFESALSGGSGQDLTRAETLADVLAARLGYFVYGGQRVDELLAFLIDRKRLAALDSFFAANNAEDIEAILIEGLSRVSEGHPDRREALAEGLGPGILHKLGLTPPLPPPKRRQLKVGPLEKTFLLLLALVLICLPPAIYASFWPVPGETAFAFLTRYVISYNRFFAYYSIAINSIYLALLALSVWQISKQLKVWVHARSSLLFTDRMLPPVSIIVPAFREEGSIVDSVQSMLSLNYPQFEIIVVCDGSPDATLTRLAEGFGLERTQRGAIERLKSAPVRGVYKSKAHPYLTVLDKENGGKADALNAGINFSRHDYLCCVDADSLLESDALLRIMYQVVASDRELVACGGNIFPVNGCVVRRGSIERYAPPASPLARFQTVEYFRAFLAGRLGWARLNSLLIISGAFGIFRRKRVLEVGGYLTGESAGHLDTVGEDMELVVRLSRHMRERKKPYKIGYAFNANCWTEVPEDWGSLWRQRDRWHRGLIEILLYHRGCAFNPRYGTVGFLGFPYFWLFELIGPFLEAFGWLAFGFAAVMGFLAPSLATLLFISTIVFGIALSTASLAIGEFGVMYYSQGEAAKLLLFSMLENLGYRQVMSFSRVTAFFSLLFGGGGWGSIKRKGFAKTAKG